MITGAGAIRSSTGGGDDVRIDEITLTDWLARADTLLCRAEGREALQARALMDRPSSVHAAPLDVVLRARVEALRAAQSSADERPSIAQVLRAERRRVEVSRDEVRTAMRAPPATDGAGALYGGLLVLATQIASMLELRVLAEREIAPGEAELLDAERRHWAGVARTVLEAVLDAQRRDLDAKPLARRVVLVAATSLATIAQLHDMLEHAGATTLLATSPASAESLLRWFHVDAVLCFLAGADDPIASVARDARAQLRGPQSPLLLALLASDGVLSPDHTAELGFDAGIPIVFAPRDALTVAMALAMRARGAVGSGARIPCWPP